MKCLERQKFFLFKKKCTSKKYRQKDITFTNVGSKSKLFHVSATEGMLRKRGSFTVTMKQKI
jgi:hypothetical protein